MSRAAKAIWTSFVADEESILNLLHLNCLTLSILAIMATKLIKTSIQIDASPKQVWQVLTNFAQYKDWNPFMPSVEGKVEVGKRIKVNAGGMNFKPTLLTRIENEQLSWIGSLLFKGIFDGEHLFRIEENPDGTVTFFHEEQFSGILVGLFAKKLDRDTRAGFESMNIALKNRVEQMKTRTANV